MGAQRFTSESGQAEEALEPPYVPDDMAESLVRVQRAVHDWQLGVSAEASYMIRPAVDAVLEDWQPTTASEVYPARR